MNRKRISRIGKYVLVTMLLTAVPASGWAQRMIKVSGTVYNIADKKKKIPSREAWSMYIAARQWRPQRT